MRQFVFHVKRRNNGTETCSLLRLSVPPTPKMMSDTSLGKIRFSNMRLCYTTACLPLLTHRSSDWPQLASELPSCDAGCLQVFNSVLALRTLEAYSVLISYGCVPSVSASPLLPKSWHHGWGDLSVVDQVLACSGWGKGGTLQGVWLSDSFPGLPRRLSAWRWWVWFGFSSVWTEAVSFLLMISYITVFSVSGKEEHNWLKHPEL